MNYKNIFWIVGGLKKVGDRFNLIKLKKIYIKLLLLEKIDLF